MYRYEHMSDVDGTVINFSDDLLYEGPVTQVNPVRLVGRYGTRPVSVPVEDAAHMDQLVDILAAEAGRPAEVLNVEVQRHLLLTLLLWARVTTTLPALLGASGRSAARAKARAASPPRDLAPERTGVGKWNR
ncbi:hypothetical protein STRIP9103_09515 [Streptomyces ipomoeae 91-03]|uniref:Uncharacterized protein n=2 Tax=Streptomyces ipomoeae TaxID=103232 RepID=L1L0R7_9ACTN|nr:hypothetical protein STRIP9103_09515 [Streptomyces ipomoeae 91-03]